jgi:hypothetical protein
MADVPEEGFCIARLSYAQEFFYNVICEQLREARLPPEMVKTHVYKAIESAYQRHGYLLCVQGESHRDYLSGVLAKYLDKPEMKYPLTLNVVSAKKPEPPPPPLVPAAVPYDPTKDTSGFVDENVVPPDAEMPGRA